MKPEIEKLGRSADRAVWAVDVAESIEDLIRVALENAKGRPYETVRAAVEGPLRELVERYRRAEREAVTLYTDAIRKRVASETSRQ